jgi:thiamine biosynthesis lipoprotein
MTDATREFFHHETCMGTVFRFGGQTPFDPATTKQLVMSACEILHEADRIFSLYKPESPLSRLARGEAAVRDLPSVVSDIWDSCEAWEKITDGWFSAFTPEHTFDPSGIVKTWAAAAGAQYLVEHGLNDITLNAGGDVWISESATGADDWRIGLHKPVSIGSVEAGALAVIDLKGTAFRAVATSGSAERGSHIWNPKAPERAAADELVQVSVVARDLVTADVWATAAFAMGNRAIDLLNRYNRAHPDKAVEALTISNTRDPTTGQPQLEATEGFSSLFAK